MQLATCRLYPIIIKTKKSSSNSVIYLQNLDDDIKIEEITEVHCMVTLRAKVIVIAT